MSSDGPLRLTVLGSATPYPSVDNPCSGYLVSSGTTRVWMDAGTGTLAPLQRHVRLDELDAIWISHLHADHSADLLTAYYGALFADIQLAAPIPLFGPPGIADRLAHFLTNGAERSPVESAFAVHELYDGHRAVVGGLTLTTGAVSHGIPAFAVRIETETGEGTGEGTREETGASAGEETARGGGTSLVYSGDTAPCAALTRLAAGCDVLLCEADSDRPPADGAAVHHTPEDAGDTATAAGAGRLIVTHVGRFLTPRQAVTRAAARFAGPVEHAEPGATFTVGRSGAS
ncbi:MBL fold metallo-hydrolase [Streptomyces sp. NPDC088124]|uniref:MBL fold metallo-hydrolase n=1 Tax=Streptomyces sp. NPDC088124 TaxID=3154654 RepID=UPI00341347CC